MLVGQPVRQLVDQRDFLVRAAAVFQHEQFLLVVVVESGRLFGQQIHGVLPQVEIGGHQSQELERQLLGADLSGFDAFFDSLLQIPAQLILVHDRVRNGAAELEAGDLR